MTHERAVVYCQKGPQNHPRVTYVHSPGKTPQPPSDWFKCPAEDCVVELKDVRPTGKTFSSGRRFGGRRLLLGRLVPPYLALEDGRVVEFLEIVQILGACP